LPLSFTRVASAVVAAFLLIAPAFGQTYPTRYISLIVPYAPGGSVDAVARVVAQKMGDRLGQSLIIENVAGAGGIVGTQKAAMATPNGYTLLFSVESTMAIAKLVSPNTVQYDSQKDFVPITLIGTSPLVLVGKKSLPADNITDLMALLRASPGKFNYASSGVGTSLHVAGEMINQQGHVSMTHVPYRVGSQMVTDLMGDQIDLAVLPIVMALPAYQSGSIKAFGVTEATRSPVAPTIPSLSEFADLKNVDVTVWFGFFAPAKTDPAIVQRLHQAITASLQEADVRAKLNEMGMRITGTPPAEFQKFLADEIDKFSVVVKTANIKAE
jgi:tripartite-type tricarboxylate transporter receptor subunit TctC